MATAKTQVRKLSISIDLSSFGCSDCEICWCAGAKVTVFRELRSTKCVE